ncbi:MAG: YSC84-related protein [Candidatus Omnitrophica bacterium]|nr:YSC84-related protein [Candidatus Omnitrophota bacterium]
MGKKFFVLVLAVAAIVCVSGFGKNVNMKPKTAAEWRDYIRYRRDEVLTELYKARPEAQLEIERAKGYAVFTSLNVNLIFASVSGGRGVVHENGILGKETFMRMAQGGIGFGLGVKDFRAVFIFDDREVLDRFLKSGWQFGTEADAAAKGGGEGAAASGAIAVSPGLRMYQFTENGLALQATVRGTKFWRDAFVNGDKGAREE